MNSGAKKFLIVVESIDVDDSSGSKANVALIKNLKKAGFQLQVYHYTRKNIQLENIPCLAIKENRRSLLFILSRLERQIRYKLKVHLNKPLEKIFGFSFTLFNDRNSIDSSLKEIQIKEYDLVLTLSKGGSFRPHHALLRMPPEWHKKWMAYIHDPYPMHLYPPPYPWKEPGYVKKEEFMRQVFSKAAYLAFPSKLLIEWMNKFFKKSTDKAVIIPHQISEIELAEIKFPSYFDSKNFNILHAGNLLWGRNPLGLIEGFKKFLKKCPEAEKNAKLIFLGNRNHYTQQLDKLQKELPRFYVSDSYIPHNEVLKMQTNACVNVILEAKSKISPFLPGKFPHCIIANKPILLLGPAKSEARRLLGGNYQYWAEIDNTEKIAKLIFELYQNWKVGSKRELDRPDLEEYLSEKYLRNTVGRMLKTQKS